MTRGGRTKDRDGPERRCIATGASGDTGAMIRFVVGPDAEIVPDLAERLPGRGIWLTASREALAKAVKKNLFSRAARQQVRVPEGLPEALEALVARRLIDHLALARKAGLALAGHDKVKARLKSGPVGALIEASDGSEQGRARLRPMAGDAPRIACLTGSELGLAFGRDHVIHAALDAGGVTDRILREAARLSGLRDCAAPSGPLQHDDDGAKDGPEAIG
ncbi:RNA-binding protein [Oceanicella sp. SM1341]|uniref:RNA-binding protein n=1 Tax=Oceanicella sp. SM1341 TaxID=1548889 RepID=UPI000E4F2D9B|nr:RNA-binding protein [Oceanicella sp. SM1341]